MKQPRRNRVRSFLTERGPIILLVWGAFICLHGFKPMLPILLQGVAVAVLVLPFLTDLTVWSMGALEDHNDKFAYYFVRVLVGLVQIATVVFVNPLIPSTTTTLTFFMTGWTVMLAGRLLANLD